MKYIAFYDTDEYAHEQRSVAPSAANVVRYMADVMSTFTSVQIISPSRTLKKSGIYKKRVHNITDMITLTQPFSIGVRTPVGRVLIVLYTRLWLFFYLLFHTEKNETIVVYHSLSIIKVIELIKKTKKIHLISEIREIYTDFHGTSSGEQKKEWRYIETADGYIFPTNLLNQRCNTKGKPYVIATGIYKPEERIREKRNDGKKHVVYAGTLRKEKGGAEAAVAAATALSSDYHVHILGYGSEERVKEIQTSIQHMSKESAATVTYDGLLRGEEFKAFLQSCHIGLSPQDPTGAFNDTSFPSKVLTYLANGLAVLSVRIPAVEQSPVGDYVHYYEIQEPKYIADAIMRIDFAKEPDKAELLQSLHAKLKDDLYRLIMDGKGGETVEG